MTTSNEPARTDTDIRQPMQQRDRKHRLAPALTDAQLDELMARFRERFRLGS